MRVTKWVDFGQEVEIEIDVADVRAAIAEAFSRATTDHLGEDGPTARDVLNALNDIAVFLKAISDEQIEDMTLSKRSIIWAFLLGQSERFAPKESSK